MVAEANRKLDEDSFLVESILSHRPKPEPLSSEFQFEVKWAGYEAPTWENAHGLSTVTVFKKYCATHKLSSKIRKQITAERKR